MSQDFENAFEEELDVSPAVGIETEAETEVEAEAAPELEGETEVAQAPIPTSFGTVTDRLSQIAEEMEDESMPLDDALDLLEEAVALGMQASSLLETDMNERDTEEEAEEAEVTNEPEAF